MTTLTHTVSTALTPRQLLSIAHLFTDEALRFGYDETSAERQWTALTTADQVQVWAIAWPPGSSTGWHDHGTAFGAFVTVRGSLREHAWHGYETISELDAGRGKHFTDKHIHDVRNESDEWAVSVHAYFPVLQEMSRYALVAGELVLTGVDTEGESW
ncbi:cysteine dioxygenase family protein [Flexivirga sp. ID2601S]|uniref:Cysteine dioxygenase family protein n=1 Tax=Flexivirga aerilata TaxID=1656889 RepID=A0A849ACG0_9MICO|nr:cysteine dioxygenase family protein [Flexivirga aerilata]NNG38574.1 cysteine dioxygenase family protein [Flexivirga aerilata]